MFSDWELPAKIFAFYIVFILLVVFMAWGSLFEPLGVGRLMRVNPDVYATLLNQKMAQSDLEANRLGPVGMMRP